MSNSEDLQRIRRLLKKVFEDLVSLSDRVLRLEDKTQNLQSRNKPKIEFEGNVEFNTGILHRRGEHRLYTSFKSGPLFQAKAKLPLPFANVSLEATGANRQRNFHLEKMLLRSSWLKDMVKLVFCPFGGNGSDIIPTLNPNADEGISRLTRQGCPVHHQMLDSFLFGGSVHRDGQMLAAGIFHADKGMPRERLAYFTQGIVSPTANLTFGIFLLHAFQRHVQASVGSSSSNAPPLPRFEIWPSGREDVRSGNFTPHHWRSESLRFGTVAAWNIDDEFVVSGWLSMRNTNYKLGTAELDSVGVAISTFPYTNIPTPKLAFQISPHHQGGHKYSVECSAKQDLDNGMEICPGIITDFSTNGICTWIGIRTLLKF